MLSDFSVELLHEIGRELSKTDQQHLRAVCKDLCLAINPLFFCTLVLKTQPLCLESGVQLLRALASGKTGWSPYAKPLTIAPGKWLNEEARKFQADLSDDAMEGLLVTALGSMVNVRSVMWDVRQGDHTWARDAVLKFLGTAPLLDAFELQVDNVTDLSLLQLSNLRKLKITTPYWTRIQLVAEIPRLVKRNPTLTSLHLSGTDIPSETWTMIRETAGWHLTDINAAYSPQLVAYISSYSGIEKLHLQYPDEGDPHSFFYSVLPRHAASLVEFSCRASYECAWSFGTDMVDTLSKLHRLTHLELSVNRADVAEPVNAVDLLLRTTATLPALRRLTISSANAQSNRGARCGNPAMNHRAAVNKAVTEVVQSFRGTRASRALVYVGGHSYELNPMNTDEEATMDAEKRGAWAYQQIPVPEGGSWLMMLG